jgi:hypothetical protein
MTTYVGYTGEVGKIRFLAKNSSRQKKKKCSDRNNAAVQMLNFSNSSSGNNSVLFICTQQQQGRYRCYKQPVLVNVDGQLKGKIQNIKHKRKM